MQDDLQTLLEKEKIIETINGLFIGTDQRDWVWVKKCFAPRVRFDMTSLTGGCACDDDAEGNCRHLEKRGARWQIDLIKFNLNTSTAI